MIRSQARGFRRKDRRIAFVGHLSYSWHVHDYRRLNSYRAALDLAENAYAMARSLPNDERFALASQLRRASTSIAINIAEGAGRGSDREFIRFLHIAIGSACEVEAVMDLVMRLHSVDTASALELKDEARDLIGRIRRLESSINS
jgi:four helix bundle protein